MFREFGIDLPFTVQFPGCQVDNSGVLILDLRYGKKANRKVKERWEE